MSRVRMLFTRSENRKGHGQGMLEFALALPIFLLLVLGVIEFGRLLAVVVSVTTAAREAARYGSAAGVDPGYSRAPGEPPVYYFQSCQGMREAAKRVGLFAGVKDANIAIGYYADNSIATVPDLSDPLNYVGKRCSDITSAYNELGPSIPRVVVKVTVQFKFLFLWLNEFPISSQSVRTIVRSVDTDVVAGPIIPAPPSWPPTATLSPTFALPPTSTPKHPTRTPSPPPTSTGSTPTVTDTATPTSTATLRTPSPPCSFIKAGGGVLSGYKYGFVVYNNSGVGSVPYFPEKEAWITQLYLKWTSNALITATSTITPDPLETATTVPDPSPTIPTPTPTKAANLVQIQFNGGNLKNAVLNDPLIYIFEGAGWAMAGGDNASVDYYFSIDTDTKLVIESAAVLLHYIDDNGRLQVCEVHPSPLVQGN